MGASGGPPDEISLVHHETDALLIVLTPANKYVMAGLQLWEKSDGEGYIILHENMDTSS
jgi:hypothetical protein